MEKKPHSHNLVDPKDLKTAARFVAPKIIGDTVIAMVDRSEPLSLENLIASLKLKVATANGDIERAQYSEAVNRLIAAPHDVP